MVREQTGGFARARLFLYTHAFMNASDEDKRLVAACVSGDREAWNRFVDTYSSFLYATIRKVLRNILGSVNADLADRVFSDVFYEIFRKDFKTLRGFSGRSRLTTYLYVIARRKCVAALRENPETAVNPVETAASSNPVGEAEAAERRRIVLDSIDKLPPRDRDALGLFYFKGLTLSGIGASMGVSPEHAGMIVKRARDKLRDILQSRKESLL
jgi:RNA polymerase sigma-70 factor (ECF subfamily)